MASLSAFSALKERVLAIPVLFVAFLFILVPFLLILRISFSECMLSVPPFRDLTELRDDYIVTIILNFENYLTIFKDPYYIKAFTTSLVIATLTTACCFVLGFGIAYGVHISPKERQSYLLLLIALPFWTSFLVRIYAWMGLLADTGLINEFLKYIGFIDTSLKLMDNPLGASIGLVYCYLPFMIFPIYSALSKIDPCLEEAAFDLGATPLKTLFFVVLPLINNGIITGCIFVFIPTIGEFVIPELLGGPELVTVGRLLWNEFFYNRNWPLASAIAVSIVVLLLIPVFWWQRQEFSRPIEKDAKA